MARGRSQLKLALVPVNGGGGKRAGAGPKPAGDEPGVSHRRFVECDGETPVHVTLRARGHVWNLRSRRCHAIFTAALHGVAGRSDFRVVHFSVLGNHVHLIVEAEDGSALARGVKALSGRMAIRLNQLMGRRGPVFADRYHAHVLRTPSEVARALAYVLGNFASHALRRGERVRPAWVDPYSSAAQLGPDGEAPPVRPALSWLLRAGVWRAREPEAGYGLRAAG